MRAGDLDREVTLQRRDAVVDAATMQPGTAWVAIATVWAAVRTSSGFRAADGAAVRALDTVEVLIRWRDDVDATIRVVHDGRELYVEAVQEIGRREGLRLVCRGRAELGAEDPDQ